MGIEKYIDHLAYDDQISLYMLVTGKERAIYTVIQKSTIRLKKDETEEEYLERVSQWYDEEPERKILTLNVVRTKNELEEKRQEIIALAKEMKHRSLSNLERGMLAYFGRIGKNNGVPDMQSYQRVDFKIVDWCRQFRSLPCNVIFIAWEKTG